MKSHITTLFINEIWHTTRQAEPVRVGLPLAQGVVFDAGELSVELASQELPLQAGTLSRWPDGSVRWALLDFQADLDLREETAVEVFRGPSGARPRPPARVRLEEKDDRLTADTGAMYLEVPKARGLRLDNMRDQSRAALAAVGGVSLSITERELGELEPGQAAVRVVCDGPLAVEVVSEAPWYAGGEHVLDARVRWRLFAGKRRIHAWVGILSRERDLHISEARVSVTPESSSPSEMRTYTTMKKSRVSDTELVYDYAVDARSDPIWYEDSPEPCWALWRGGEGGVTASIRNPDRHFPTRIAVTPGGIELDVQPSGQDAFHMYPWMAKTKEVCVEFVSPEKSGYEITLDSALFQRPVRPACSPEYYAACGAFGDIFPSSRKYAAFEGLISTSLRERTVGSGAMHYGDEPNLGYTYSQRGHGELVWTNGEYDTPRMLIMQYARTSNRSCFEAAEAAAFHWMDIDFLRDSPNPRWAGGLCCHEGDHRVAAYAGPSHEWAEGLIDYYHLTGYEEALEVAESIGDNVCRYIEDGEFDRIGAYALRELGWGLTAMAGCLRATNKSRYRETGLRAVRILRRWSEDFGGLKDVWSYAEPGREGELMPLSVRRDAFISLTLNGLNRFYLASGEEEARELFLEQVRAQLEWFNSPEGWAEQRETKIPNVEAFGYGYRYTGDRAYLRAGIQILEYVLNNCMLRYYNMPRPVLDTSRDHPATYRFQEVHVINSQILGLALIPMFSFMQIAEEAGALDWLRAPAGLGDST